MKFLGGQLSYYKTMDNQRIKRLLHCSFVVLPWKVATAFSNFGYIT